MQKSLDVLLVEDSEDDALLLRKMLDDGGLQARIQRVETLSGVRKGLALGKPDLLICDHLLPGFDSLQVLEIFKELNLDIPFIIVSGVIGEEVAVAAMRGGACDYVMKSHLGRLLPAIRRELAQAEERRAKRRAQVELRRNEEELNDFFENASVGLHIMGPDGTILRANQAELGLLGYEREEYAGRLIHDFYTDKSLAGELVALLHSGEKVADFEASLRRKDGSLRHVMINSSARWENGLFVSARTFTRDITDRKSAEESRAYLASIVESSEDAIIGTSLDGSICSWNGGASRLYGYAREEVLGRSITILTPHYRPDEWPLDIQGRNGFKTCHVETIRQRKDGSGVEVAMILSPIRNEEGLMTGVSSIESDIGAVKKEENQKLELISELTEALRKINTLNGLLPICSSCKSVRDDKGYWERIDSYISARTETAFTHGLCPDCAKEMNPLYPHFAPSDPNGGSGQKPLAPGAARAGGGGEI